MTNPLAAPMPFEVIWYEDGDRRRVTTHSEGEARTTLRRQREAGLDASMYVGNLEIDAVTPEQNRRRLVKLRAGEGTNSRTYVKPRGGEAACTVCGTRLSKENTSGRCRRHPIHVEAP